MFVYKNMLIKEFKKDISVSQKREIMLAEMRYKNPNIKAINFNLAHSSEGWIIDLSYNKEIKDLWILQKLGAIYVKRLDLSSTYINPLAEILSEMHIEELILRNWPSVNLSFLKGRRILHIDVSGSQIDISSFIHNSSIITLNIRNSPFKKWQLLSSLKFLKELTVSKGQIPQDIKEKLKSKVKIIEL